MILRFVANDQTRQHRQLDHAAISNDHVFVEPNAIKNLALFGGVGALLYAVFTAHKQAQLRQGEATYMPLVQAAAAANGIPASVLAGIVTAESSWNNAPNSNSARCGANCIASSVCALGLAQVMPATARGVGVTGDLCDPATNLDASARYLRQLYGRYGDWKATAEAYNAGPGNYAKGNIGSGTIAYADKVVAAASKYTTAGIGFISRPATVSMFRLRAV